MNYGKLITASEVHWINAAEAAYETLFGLFLPRRGFLWTSAISTNLELAEEEWLVEAMDVHHFDATGLRYQGRLMEIFSVQRPGTGPLDLPSNGLQFAKQRVTLDHPGHVNRGVGFRIRGMALADTDGIQLSILFRVVQQ